MNKARRKAIREIGDQLETLAERIEEIRDEEQEYIDNMPDSMQSSERAEVAWSTIGSLDEATSSLEEARSSMNEATV